MLYMEDLQFSRHFLYANKHDLQIVDREQELMSTAGLQSLGGGAGLGRGGLDRELRIVPSKP